MWQHDETGRTGFVDCWQVENGRMATRVCGLSPNSTLLLPAQAQAGGGAADTLRAALMSRSWKGRERIRKELRASHKQAQAAPQPSPAPQGTVLVMLCSRRRPQAGRGGFTGQASRWVRTSPACPSAFSTIPPYAARQSSNTAPRAVAYLVTAAGGSAASRRAASRFWSRRPSETRCRRSSPVRKSADGCGRHSGPPSP